MNFRKAGLYIAILIGIVLVMLNRQPVQLTKQDKFICSRISSSGYEIKWVMHLRNANLLSSTIQQVKQRLSLEGKELANLQLDLNQGIPGRKETVFPVSVRFEADSNFSINGKQVLLKGEITYSNLTGGGTIRVNELSSKVVVN